MIESEHETVQRHCRSGIVCRPAGEIRLGEAADLLGRLTLPAGPRGVALAERIVKILTHRRVSNSRPGEHEAGFLAATATIRGSGSSEIGRLTDRQKKCIGS